MSTFVYTTEVVSTLIVDDVVAGVFNNSSFGGKLRVRQISIYPTSGQSMVGMESVRYARITGVTGGFPMTPLKFDPSSASLPAQVNFLAYPEAVTESNTLWLRRDQLNSGTMSRQRFGGGVMPSKMDMGGIYRQRSSSVLESIILREGEGAAAILTSFGLPHESSFSVVVTNLTTGATYTYRNDAFAYPRLLNPIACIFNGAGSGVVLAVRIVEAAFEGDMVAPTYRVCRIQGVTDEAVDESAICFDPAVPQPGWVRCFKGPALSRLFGYQGLPLTWYQDSGAQVSVLQQHKAGTFRARSTAPWGFDADSPLIPMANPYLLYKDSAGTAPLTIGSGEGIAILTGTAGVIDQSALTGWGAEFIFTTSEPQKLGASGASVMS